jgi:hypothetical protein
LTGSKEFVGRSSFQDSKMADHAKNLAKLRAQSRLDSYMKSLAAEGYDLSNSKTTGTWQVGEHGAVVCTLKMTFA